MSHAPLHHLTFDNRFVRELPGDPEPGNRPRTVMNACYSRVAPTPVQRPELLAYAREVAELLGIAEDEMHHPELPAVFGGNRVLPGMEPYAACYGGHQFGNWAGQLGDGRAITLGEVMRPDGERWELQLKGAGPTPYSRTADGRAVMRSSVREFLCSEAMHHLGVPTTRALSLVSTGDRVLRDMFYDGNAQLEPGAIVCRVAPSFLRFGNYELFAARGDERTLRRLVDYTLCTHFPELGPPSADAYVRWFEEVCRRTAIMIAHWMRVGFVHGVMNTDNMSVLGLTIDYGPYGWLEDYDPNWTPNTTDAHGRRYRYGHQPRVAMWNLARFGGALIPLVGDAGRLERALEVYASTFEHEQRAMLTAKLGLDEIGVDADPLVDDLPAMLQLAETDMTIFYRKLADVDVRETDVAGGDVPQPDSTAADRVQDAQRLPWRLTPLQDAFYDLTQLTPSHVARWTDWLDRYAVRVREAGLPEAERRARMRSVNPKYVLRNYLAQLAIDRAEQGDGTLVCELLEVLRRPYDEQPAKARWAEKRPEWARHRPGCSMLSCSS